MPKLGWVALILGFLVTSLASKAAIDAAGDGGVPSSQPSKEVRRYEFAPSPATNADLVYRIDRATGEVGACVFSPKGPIIGSTACFSTGEGGGPQRLGDYDLIPSNMTTANGVFRVNRLTGEMSVCYVLNERVVCTDAKR